MSKFTKNSCKPYLNFYTGITFAIKIGMHHLDLFDYMCKSAGIVLKVLPKAVQRPLKFFSLLISTLLSFALAFTTFFLQKKKSLLKWKNCFKSLAKLNDFWLLRYVHLSQTKCSSAANIWCCSPELARFMRAQWQRLYSHASHCNYFCI